MTDYDALEQALRGSEVLIHLAAIPKPFGHSDHEVHNTNVVGSYNALRAAVEVGMTRICQASSVNAIGHAYSRKARYDYFPVDELHPTYNEDPYSLSKWVCEQQADSIVRRYAGVSVVSLRFHWVVADRSDPDLVRTYSVPKDAAANLAAYTRRDAAAQACLLALTAPSKGMRCFSLSHPTQPGAARHSPSPRPTTLACRSGAT